MARVTKRKADASDNPASASQSYRALTRIKSADGFIAPGDPVEADDPDLDALIELGAVELVGAIEAEAEEQDTGGDPPI